MPKIHRVFSKRSFGNMSLFYGDTKEALNNRENFLAGLGIDYKNLVCAKQVHGNRARYVTEKDKGRGALSYEDSLADTDSLATDKFNLPLAIFTADCLSVFLYDLARPVIGLVHAGWRSSKENIIAKTVILMQERFKTRPKDVHAAFGPCIRKCCYKIGEDFAQYFPEEYLPKKNGQTYLDLIGINKKLLLENGIQEANISDSGICTCCRNQEFFSFRKEGKNCGRMMSIIMLA